MKENIQKLIIGVLTALVLGVGGVAFKFYRDTLIQGQSREDRISAIILELDKTETLLHDIEKKSDIYATKAELKELETRLSAIDMRLNLLITLHIEERKVK